MTVLIDLHGVPGSQNGQDNSGLIGPILFPANTTNTERTLNVLRNLTEEFSRAEYGGVVTCESRMAVVIFLVCVFKGKKTS
jgi:glucan 1,3-beta-glucosidase